MLKELYVNFLDLIKKNSKYIVAFFIVLLFILILVIIRFNHVPIDFHNKTIVTIREGHAKGIDISSWQEEVDWDQVAESDIDFVMIRCGLRSTNSSNIYEDKNFKYNIENANRVGLPVGVYFYSTAINKEEVIEEADFVLNLVKDYKIIYPIAYDFELFGEQRTENLSLETINENALTFINYIESFGYNTLLYTNTYNLYNYWFDDTINNTHIWYAKYLSEIEENKNYYMWQYAENGRVSGIKGSIDLNESFYIYEEE